MCTLAIAVSYLFSETFGVGNALQKAPVDKPNEGFIEVLQKRVWRRETAMDRMFDFAGVAGAIVLSIMFGVYVEWLALRALIRFLPATGPAPGMKAPVAAIERNRQPNQSRAA